MLPFMRVYLFADSYGALCPGDTIHVIDEREV
jgi:hypothetical protein